MNYNKKNFELNLIIIFFFSLFSLCYFLLIPNFLSENFIIDSHMIRNSMMNSTSFVFGSSYNNGGLFFNLLGFHYYTSDIVIHLFSWVVFQLFLFTILRVNKYHIFSIIQCLFIGIFIMMYGIYFTNFSKDLILIIFLIISVNLYINNNNMVYIILFIGLYGLFFRSYWLLLFIFSLFIYFQKNPRFKNNIIYIITISLLFIIIYDLWTGNFITNFRLLGNNNANTLINNLMINTSIVSDIINYLYTLISLIIPIQGLKGGHEIIYYLWIISIIYIYFINKKRINLKLILLFISYVSIQTLFEPDFGSVFRHQLALFPLLYLILFKYEKKKTYY